MKSFANESCEAGVARTTGQDGLYIKPLFDVGEAVLSQRWMNRIRGVNAARLEGPWRKMCVFLLTMLTNAPSPTISATDAKMHLASSRPALSWRVGDLEKQETTIATHAITHFARWYTSSLGVSAVRGTRRVALRNDSFMIVNMRMITLISSCPKNAWRNALL